MHWRPRKVFLISSNIVVRLCQCFALCEVSHSFRWVYPVHIAAESQLLTTQHMTASSQINKKVVGVETPVKKQTKGHKQHMLILLWFKERFLSNTSCHSWVTFAVAMASHLPASSLQAHYWNTLRQCVFVCVWGPKYSIDHSDTQTHCKPLFLGCKNELKFCMQQPQHTHTHLTSDLHLIPLPGYRVDGEMGRVRGFV